MLNSGVLVEDGVVSGLAFLSVVDLVLVGVSSLWLISVGGDGVGSLKDLDLVSVSVLFFLSVENFVVGLIAGEWDISPSGLSVVSIGKSWFPCVSEIFVFSVLDLVGQGVSDFLLLSVFGDILSVSGGHWDLSSSDFSLGLGVDLVVSLLVEDLNISEAGVFTILGVGVHVWFRFISILDSDSVDGSDKGKGEFHCGKKCGFILLITATRFFK